MQAKIAENERYGIVLDRAASDRLYEALTNPRPPSAKLMEAARRYKEDLDSGRILIRKN